MDHLTTGLISWVFGILIYNIKIQKVSGTRMYHPDCKNLLMDKIKKKQPEDTSRNCGCKGSFLSARQPFLATGVPLSCTRHPSLFIINCPFMFKLTWVGFCSMYPVSANKATAHKSILLSDPDTTSLFDGYQTTKPNMAARPDYE